MMTLIKQELYKLYKKKSTLVLSILLVVYTVGMALLSKNYPSVLSPEMILPEMFGGLSIVVFIMIAAGSSSIAMESQFGTLKNLLYRQYSRGQVLASKWITLLIYSAYLYALTYVLTIVAKFTMFPSIKLSQLIEGSNSITVLDKMGYNMLGNFVGLWLIISLVLMISCWFNSSGAAISLGIVFYFASSILSGILMIAIQKWEWVKWNPVNMLNLAGQISMDEMSEMTRLSTNQLYAGNIVYMAIFLGLGYIVFKKKSV